ncbi:MAG: LysR family transcriptional regulator [Paenalcaligenes sp.]
MQWSLEQLRQFVVTAEQGSISAAARHLGKAQSAVSTAISLLEADLGVELFTRSGRSAQLTEPGRVLLMEARELLRQAQELEQRAQSLAAGDDASLSLALDEALPYTAIRTLIREMSDRFPQLELTLLNGTAAEVAGYVEQQRVDIAFHYDREMLHDCFDQRHISTVPQGIFVASGHPLLQQQPVSRKDLMQYRQLVMHTDGDEETTYSTRLWHSDSFYSIAEMVADDVGWAILPLNVATDDSYPKPLKQVHCPSLTLPLLSVRMLWLQGQALNPTARWVEKRFAELLKRPV